MTSVFPPKNAHNCLTRGVRQAVWVAVVAVFPNGPTQFINKLIVEPGLPGQHLVVSVLGWRKIHTVTTRGIVYFAAIFLKRFTLLLHVKSPFADLEGSLVV